VTRVRTGALAREDRTKGLEVSDLTISISSSSGATEVVSGVNFEVRPGEIVGLVGESGSGKTLSSLALLGILPPVARVTAGSASLDGIELLSLPQGARRAVNGQRIAMVFQEAKRSLDPMKTIGAQISAVVRAHRDVSRKQAHRVAVRMLDEVGVPDPGSRARDLPAQLSGGLAQRALIAMALACEPGILIADEPTTALDMTVQARILRLLTDLRSRRNLGILIITHDIGVVAEICDRTVVMYAGEVIEDGPTRDLLQAPRHPYLSALLSTARYPAKKSGPLSSIPGQVPPAAMWPAGCRFRGRCAFTVDSICAAHPRVAVQRFADGRGVRCARSQELAESGVLRGRP
jgi:oligopeptide/dipeptide ABC transporter ATP-binding protein